MKKEDTDKIRFSAVDLNSYNAPEIEENEAEEYVTYGADNEYFRYVDSCYKGSPTNRAIINTISLLIYGKGLDATDKDTNPKKWEQVEKLFKPNDLRLVAQDLKKFGGFAMQIAYAKKGKKIIGTKHHPVDTLAKSKFDENGEINSYWYSPDWSNTQKYPPEEIPAFGTGAKLEILYVSLYTSGLVYYADCDYQAGLQYCKTEEEMSNYHINSIKNGFSPTILMKFKDGVPDIKEQMIIEGKIKDKWSGSSNANKLLVTFSDNADEAPEFDTMDVPEAHSRFTFLSEEATQKILTSHRVTSPMLLGIKSDTGLGNNADELKTASQLFNAIVIRPFQDIITDALDTVLEVNGIEFDLYFETLQPIEFTEDGIEETTDDAEVQKETGIEQTPTLDKVTENLNMDDDAFRDLLRDFGRTDDVSDDYEEIRAESAQGEPLEIDYEQTLNEAIELSSIQKSSQDSPFYKVRYRYVKGSSKTPVGETRQFCRTMLNLAGQGVVYRKEDILKMSDMGINGDFAHSGGKYNIFLYAGGVNCHHIWERVIYKKKALPNGKPYGGNATQNTTKVSGGQAKKKGFNAPANPKDVTIAEIDKPNKGRYNG